MSEPDVEVTTEAPSRPSRRAAAQRAAGRQIVRVTSKAGSGPELQTPAGTAPVIPLLMIGFGGYLMWFGVKYWRGTGPAVWPSYPVKSVLQGKGVPPNNAAPTAELQLAAFEQQIAAQGSKGGTPPGPGGPAPPPGASETMIIRAILAGMQAPQTQANINSMAAWIRHETPWPPVAKFNPMNTTLPMPGATDFNSVGVKNYTSWPQGIQATILTLEGGYPGIVAGFQSGLGVCGQGHAAEFLKWSGGGYSSVC